MTNSRYDDNQFVISVELLKVLAWLLENRQESLKTLLTEALNEIQHNNELTSEYENAEILQETIIDFFSVLECLITEIGHEEESKKTVQRNLIPAIDHIDNSACDKATVASSIAKATSVCAKSTSKSAQDVMFKELLKRWKPQKKLFN